jgi:flagellar biosynthetic protein FliR
MQLGTLLEAGSVVFAAALQMALPVIVALTIVNLALGVLARAAPQMNLISVGFPITLMVGLVAFGTALPYVLQLVERNLLAAVELVLR